MKLQDKVAIVTGAVARTFAQEGARVVVAERNVASGEETAQRLQQAGYAALFVPTDVSQNDQVRQLIDETMAAYARLDILVNNAGIAGVTNPSRPWTKRTGMRCWTST